MIKVSVIVPIYNKEEYLVQCLDSIVNQTLKDIEIILIDDGSTDNSAEICKRYLNDTRVSYYYKQNEGLAAARQDGIEKSRGEYMGFIDADDWIEPNMYEVMYSSAVKYLADVVYCNKVYGDDGYRPDPEISSGVYNRERILSEILPKTLAFINKNGDRRCISPNNCRRIYKKQTLLDICFAFNREFRRSQDMQLTYLGEERLYHTRPVGDSLSRGYTKNMWSLYVPLIERLYKDTEEFTERDFMPQMHLRNFFYVTECIDNEFKPTCPHGREVQIEKINEIMNHPLTEKYYGHIEVEKLNPLLQGYYRYIHEKDAEGLMNFVEKYIKQSKRKAARKAKVMDFLTESKVVGTAYKKIRGKS